MKKLLLHMCCAPCSIYPLSVLHDEGFEVFGIFYNPNIHPIDEFLRRKENVQLLSETKKVNIDFYDDFSQNIWENFNSGNNERCRMCYAMRLEKVASTAKEKGFFAYTTTLLISPYQNHELIKELGEKFAEKYGVEFYYKDFREGFRYGQSLAKEMGLYRQKYCGCIVSFNER